MSTRELAASIAAGRTTAEAHARSLLDRIADSFWIGALLDVVPDRILEAARQVDRHIADGADPGPLAGVPFAVKDNIDVSGWPTTACTPALAGNIPRTDAEAVARLKAAGAVVLGKAAMHELAMGGTSNNPHMDPVRNPHAPDYIAGGSSGGTAAAVAAGFCTFGLGSDTGGSVPIPASLCGIAGLRPSMGRYPTGGLFVTNPSRDVIGPMAASADDLRLIDAVISGQAECLVPAPDRLRFALPRGYFWEGADETVQEALSRAVATLAAAGVSIVETEVEDVEALNEAASAGLRIEPSFALRDSCLPGSSRDDASLDRPNAVPGNGRGAHRDHPRPGSAQADGGSRSCSSPPLGGGFRQSAGPSGRGRAARSDHPHSGRSNRIE